MSLGSSRSATQRLSHVRLELSPRRTIRRWLVGAALLMAVLVAGAGLGYVGRGPAPARAQAPVADLAPALRQSVQQLDQTRLALRLSGARSQELERQVDALNQRLRESTEELTFFRKAREGKQP